MWWSDGEWAALHDSETCAMCADSGTAENAHSLLVAETKTSRVRLSRNQEHRGYCIVILRDHRTDLTHLSADELAGFWLDVQRAGMAIDHVFEPRKIDYLVMGHRMPHLHCHVFPQHAHDDPMRLWLVDVALRGFAMGHGMSAQGGKPTSAKGGERTSARRLPAARTWHVKPVRDGSGLHPGRR